MVCTQQIVSSVSDHFRRPICSASALPFSSSHCRTCRLPCFPVHSLRGVDRVADIYSFFTYLLISYMDTLKYGHTHPTFPSSNLSQLPHRVPLTTSSSSPLFLYTITQSLISATDLLSMDSLPVAARREGWFSLPHQ